MAYWEVLRETFLETILALPLLLAVYYLIELIEYKWAAKLQNNRWLRGKASPVLAALVGSIPQCGFSVVATDLYAQRLLSVGALLAVFIATSDEALPLLLTHPQNWLAIVVLIVVKIVVAVLVGYGANLLAKVCFRRRTTAPLTVTATTTAKEPAHDEHEHEHEHTHEHDDAHADDGHAVHLHAGCCHHSMHSQRFDWRHPLWHSLKIWVFIFTVSLLFGFVAEIWVGEARLTEFLNGSFWLQPLLAILVGLIPNCAASVVLTEFYLVGGLRFGALLGGLCVNAGLGLIFLLRQKGMWREKCLILTCLVVTGLLVGYGFLWLAI